MIEMMLVIAIIGILGAIAMPNAQAAIRASHEAQTKGNLAALRGAIAMYYSTHDSYPVDKLQSLVAEQMLLQMPAAWTEKHGESAKVFDNVSSAAKEGGWRYNDDNTDVGWGNVAVNCIHTDRRGAAWSMY